MPVCPCACARFTILHARLRAHVRVCAYLLARVQSISFHVCVCVCARTYMRTCTYVRACVCDGSLVAPPTPVLSFCKGGLRSPLARLVHLSMVHTATCFVLRDRSPGRKLALRLSALQQRAGSCGGCAAVPRLRWHGRLRWHRRLSGMHWRRSQPSGLEADVRTAALPFARRPFGGLGGSPATSVGAAVSGKLARLSPPHPSHQPHHLSHQYPTSHHTLQQQQQQHYHQ